ncbi:MAG: 3-oxoadipate enol-lactonase [Rubellimicrobium sp.]|nr:3-oxoadipate enol-lactonase [Rubellimicrobium sp.]
MGRRTPSALVLLHALGTDHRIWDGVVARLPPALRIIRPDMRGHGASDVPPAPYGMGRLVSDVEAICDALGIRDAVVVGLSIGGLIAQGLAVKRLDLVRGLVLSNTAARIGNAGLWADRIAAVRTGGMAAIAEATLERWAGRDLPGTAGWDLAREMLLATDPEGWIGCAHAVAGADFLATTATLRLAVLGIAGGEDGSVPPDMLRETLDLIPGARFHLMRRAGHLPCLEDPEGHAAVLAGYLAEIGHV